MAGGPWEKYQNQPQQAPVPMGPRDPRVDASAEASRASAGASRASAIASRASAGSSSASAARTRQQTAMDAQLAPLQRRLTAAETAIKEGQSQKLQADMRARQEKANTIMAMVNRQEGLYNQSFKGQPASRLWGLTEKIDALPVNETFRTAGQQILPLVRPMVAQSAKEGDSDKEMEIFKSYIPHNDDSDRSIENKFKALKVLVAGLAQGRPPSELEKIYGLNGRGRTEPPRKRRVIDFDEWGD